MSILQAVVCGVRVPTAPLAAASIAWSKLLGDGARVPSFYT